MVEQEKYYLISPGFNAGLSRGEILAIVNTMSICSGFSATLNALFVTHKNIRDRATTMISDRVHKTDKDLRRSWTTTLLSGFYR